MIDVDVLISKYYDNNLELKELLILHSRMVANKAMAAVHRHPELKLNADFVYEGAMLHDIGIFQTDAPGIHCYGTEPYLCHGVLGANLLRSENLPRHARVAERHTGAGLTKEQIIQRQLPLPHQDFLPETLEEQLICYADKFFSKTRPSQEKSFDRVVAGLERFGTEGAERFVSWHKLFG